MGSAGHDAHGVAHPRPHPRGERAEPRRPARRSPLISRTTRWAPGRVGPEVPVGWSVWRLRPARAPPDSRPPWRPRARLAGDRGPGGMVYVAFGTQSRLKRKLPGPPIRLGDTRAA